MASVTTLQRITAQTLSEMLLAQGAASASSTAVVDVRDDDYIGGHIKGSTNVPSRSLDARLPTLVRRLKHHKVVVFHCTLSQQRGPSAALKYMRERDGLLEQQGEGPGVPQTVYVLDRGFSGWQEVYGEDERLTEGYRKELWQD